MNVEGSFVWRLMHVAGRLAALYLCLPERQSVQANLAMCQGGARLLYRLAMDLVQPDERRPQLYAEARAALRGGGGVGWERLFQTAVPPCMAFLCFEFVWGAFVAPVAADYCGAGLLSLPADLLAWPRWAATELAVELVYVLLSLLSFVNILYFVMGFEKYGQFVLMLMQAPRGRGRGRRVAAAARRGA